MALYVLSLNMVVRHSIMSECHVQRLERVHSAGLHTALGALASTPVVALQAEANEAPLCIFGT